MHTLDYTLLALYPAILLAMGIYKRLRPDSSASELIVGGRRLTLPAFIASLVSTYYGGVLAVGEYSFTYGVSNWLVFGLPYYIAAALFALFLARQARESELLTIPERLSRVYGERTALMGSIVIFLMSVPAAYVLMLGILCQQLLGWPFWLGILVGVLFSVAYLFYGGFNAVVRTDLLQFGLMFAGFAMLLTVLVSRYGFFGFLQSHLPADHMTWHGGNSGWYIASWYVIALATLVEPAFFQRCYAARTPAVARNGIIGSIFFWMLFDFMTTSCGLYARALLPDLADPVAAFPALALAVLPSGMLGLFGVAMMATVMSTIDSYSFLAATTFSHDILPRLKRSAAKQVAFYTRIGLLLSTVLAVGTALFFRSAVDIWHAFGSIGTPALLVPVFFAFFGKRRMPPGAAMAAIIVGGSVSLGWYLTKYLVPGDQFWLGVEPIFPALVVSLLIHLATSRSAAEALPSTP